MNYNTILDIDKTSLDEVNLSGEVSTKEERIKGLINNFNKSDEIWSGLPGITYGDLVEFYEPIPMRDVIYKIATPYQSTFLLPSKGQRSKFSVIKEHQSKGEDSGSSTWNYSQISEGLISWITQTSVPTIKINVVTFEKYGYAGIWDGESKFQGKWRFYSQDDSKVWMVLDEDGNFNSNEARFIKSSDSRWDNTRNKNNRSRLLKALKLFKSQFIVTKQQFITKRWLYENNFSDLFEYLYNLKPNIILERKTDGTESESYHREGSCISNQSPVNLTMTMIKDAWFDCVVYDNSKNPRNVHRPAVLASCFSKSDKSNPFLRNINKEAYGNEKYNEQDKYVYHFLTSCLIQLNGKIKYGNVNMFDNKFYNGLARPTDSKGASLVQGVVADYIETSRTKEKQLESVFKKVFNMTETCLGYNRTKSDRQVGLNNKQIVKTWKGILNKETEIFRQKLRNIGQHKEGNLGKVNKLRLQQKELLYPVIISAMGYTLENPNLTENNLTEVLQTVLSVISEQWHDYVWSFPIDFNESSNKFKFDYSEDDWDVCIQSSTELTDEDKPTFGPLYHFNGGNIEKVFAVYHHFYNDKILPILEEEYKDSSTTGKERTKFLNYIRTSIQTRDLSDFNLYNTRDSVLRKVEEFDIGHLDADVEGGVLRDKMWIFEFFRDNRHKFKVNKKSFDLFWKEMMANTNDIESHRFTEWLADRDNEDLKQSWEEADNVKKNLKIVVEYFDITYDKTFSFINGTVKLDSYVNELEKVTE